VTELPTTSARRSAFLRLFLCGAAVLFWELALIRWTGSCVRVIAYYTNFILISAFFGLGAGALLVRFRARLWHWIVPVLCVGVLLGPVLGEADQLNPSSEGEFVWQGRPSGVQSQESPAEGFPARVPGSLPYWLILVVTYVANASIFLVFGQWLGALFRAFRPLTAYTIEIGGSVLGILLFSSMSALALPPPAWFVVGFALVLPILDRWGKRGFVLLALAVATVAAVTPYAARFQWSPYYKIHATPLVEIGDRTTGELLRANRPFGAQVTVNSDYHQMMLDLEPRVDEHPFLRSWRWTYDFPYRAGEGSPEGPVLIVGAGTGNDVSAALRAGVRAIDAVEIAPLLVALGRDLHPERPYADPRVRVIVNDARSFLVSTDRRYAKVVFGFLDSHTLMSSFSSLRLDNFVYTREAMERVEELLLPGGRVYLTFASNTRWLDRRLAALLEEVFDRPTVIERERRDGYSNGIIYVNGKSAAGPGTEARDPETARIPTDDWPFLYMKDNALPAHYRLFVALVVLTGVGALGLLPRGRRRIRFPYFFLGAGFFLIETSNVVSLSLLYGSTWVVNVSVFAGILVLVLAGNLTCMLMRRSRFPLLFAVLLASVLVGYLTPASALLGIENRLLQGAAAVTIFLGPVYVASLIFGRLIRQEESLYQAYGSNLLGAVIGGSCEYLSIVTGLKFLLLVTFACYALALVFWRIDRGRAD
jgi:SAM-dependent methyltransferase